MTLKLILESHPVPSLKEIVKKKNQDIRKEINNELKEETREKRKEMQDKLLIDIKGLKKDKSEIIKVMMKHAKRFKDVEKFREQTEDEIESNLEILQEDLNSITKQYLQKKDVDQLKRNVDKLFKKAKIMKLKQKTTRPKMIESILADVKEQDAVRNQILKKKKRKMIIVQDRDSFTIKRVVIKEEDKKKKVRKIKGTIQKNKMTNYLE